jgi:archaellum component FlaC
MFHKYPYSNFHELNLDWILAKITEFETKLQEWSAIAEQLEEGLELINSFQQQLDALKAEVDALDLDAIKSDINTLYGNVRALQAADAVLQGEITSLVSRISHIVELINQLDNKIDVNIARLRREFNSDILDLRKYVDETAALIQAELEELTSLVEWLVENLSTTIRNPLRDKRYSFDKNNELVYTDLSYGALSAYEYDYLGLTAEEFSKFNFSAIKYFLYGKFILKKPHWTIMPVQGIKQSVANALSDAVTFCAKTLTATDYFNMNLTAAEFESLDMTSEEYLTYGSEPQEGDIIVYNNILFSDHYTFSVADEVASFGDAGATVYNGILSFT